MSTTPVYTHRVSPNTMAEQSRKATAEGLRNLSKAMASCDGWESDEDCDFIPIDTATDKLEDRIRFLKLDLSNAYVVIEESKERYEELSNILKPIRHVNDELTFLKSSMERAFRETELMNVVQLEKRYQLFYEEAHEHSMLCNNQIAKINMVEIKHALLRVLNAENKRLAKIERNFRYLIFWVKAKEFMLWSSLIILVFAILVKLLF